MPYPAARRLRHLRDLSDGNDGVASIEVFNLLAQRRAPHVQCRMHRMLGGSQNVSPNGAKNSTKSPCDLLLGVSSFSCLTVMSQTGKSHDSLEPYASPPVPSCSTKSKRSCNVASRIDIQKEFGTIFAGLESLESVKRSNIGSPPVNLVNYHLCGSHPSFFMQIIFPHFPRVFPHLFGDLWSSWPGRSWSLRAISNWIWLGCRTPMDAKMGGGPGRSTCAAYCGLQMGNLGECCPGFPLGSRFKFWVMLFRWSGQNHPRNTSPSLPFFPSCQIFAL